MGSGASEPKISKGRFRFAPSQNAAWCLQLTNYKLRAAIADFIKKSPLVGDTESPSADYIKSKTTIFNCITGTWSALNVGHLIVLADVSSSNGEYDKEQCYPWEVDSDYSRIIQAVNAFARWGM